MGRYSKRVIPFVTSASYGVSAWCDGGGSTEAYLAWWRAVDEGRECCYSGHGFKEFMTSLTEICAENRGGCGRYEVG